MPTIFANNYYPHQTGTPITPQSMMTALTNAYRHDDSTYHIRDQIHLYPNSYSSDYTDVAYLLYFLHPYLKKDGQAFYTEITAAVPKQEIAATKEMSTYAKFLKEEHLPPYLQDLQRQILTVITKHPGNGIMVVNINRNAPSVRNMFLEWCNTDEFTRQANLEAFFNSTGGANKFVIKDNTKDLYIILIDATARDNAPMNNLLIRKIFSIFPKLCLSSFNPQELAKDKPLAKLFQIFAEGEQDIYTSTLMAYAEAKYNLRQQMLKNTLYKFNQDNKDRVINQHKNQKAKVERDIKDYEASLATRYNQLREETIWLAGADQTDFNIIKEDDFDMIASLGSIENMQVQTSNGRSVLNVVWQSPLEIIDEDVLMQYRQSKRETEWTDPNSIINKILQVTCIDKTHILKMKWGCYIYIESGNFELNNNFQNTSSQTLDWIIHPHLVQWTCIGDYRNQVNNALRKNDLPFALVTLHTAGKSINLADGRPIGDFIRQLNHYRKYITMTRKEDGAIITVDDVLKNTKVRFK